jgi:hypothetical protein
MKDEGESRDKNPMASWRKESPSFGLPPSGFGWYRAEMHQDAHD